MAALGVKGKNAPLLQIQASFNGGRAGVYARA
jgi:hypothetical protein